MRAWLPRIYWSPVEYGEARSLGLDMRFRWESLAIEWLGRGVILACRPLQK